MVRTFQLIVVVSSNPRTARDPTGLLTKALSPQMNRFVLGLDSDSVVNMRNVKTLCNKVLT